MLRTALAAVLVLTAGLSFVPSAAAEPNCYYVDDDGNVHVYPVRCVESLDCTVAMVVWAVNAVIDTVQGQPLEPTPC